MTSILVWFRRDLRLQDHAALFHALQHAQCTTIYCAFIFDTDILAPLPPHDRRVSYIHAAVQALNAELHQHSSTLIVRVGSAVPTLVQLASELGVDAVYANRDYEPLAVQRDAEVASQLQQIGCGWVTYKDHVIFECDEILNQTGQPYSVFTPYRKNWETRLTPACWQAFDCRTLRHKFAKLAPTTVIDLESIGFAAVALPQALSPAGAAESLQSFAKRIEQYAQLRDFPARNGPSYMSVHLRFGTVSIRTLLALAQAHEASEGARVWRAELVWREFYQMLLWHRPDVVEHCFQVAFDDLAWDDSAELLSAWQQGQTGYPLVDAAMRQLLQTGYMHNRLRMVVASFLCKDLGVNWRAGEAWFARLLLDFDLAANNGGWQWAASTGCDAQPWFRIFNPITQSEKFDPQGKFIRRYVPEIAALPDAKIHAPWRLSPSEQQQYGVHIGQSYPLPIVDHAQARLTTLARYAKVKETSAQPTRNENTALGGTRNPHVP